VNLVLTTAVVASLALTGCSGDDAPQGGEPTGTSAPSVMDPTAAPSDLTPAQGTGEELTLGEHGTFVVPEGSTTEPGTTQVPGAEQVLVRMPDAGEQGVPALQVTWQPEASAGALEQSWSTEKARTVDPTVSDYERAPVEWPGSDASVVATWSEDVPLAAGGTAAIDALGLWLQAPDGTVVLAIAFAPEGELDGSTSLEALRTLTVG
jgi:hypothetical protein